MHTEALSHPPRLRVPRQPPEASETEGLRDAAPIKRSGSRVDHDAALLLAALEEIESCRAAVEWLAERDLLYVCLA